MTAKQTRFSPLLLFYAYMQSHSFSSSNLVLAVPSTEILEWITDLYIYFQTLYINETHTHISKTELFTSFLDVNLSDFDLYILKKFIPLLVLCIPILWGTALQCDKVSVVNYSYVKKLRLYFQHRYVLYVPGQILIQKDIFLKQ